MFIRMQLYSGVGCINSHRSYVYVAILFVLQQRLCRPLCSFACSYIVGLGVLTHTGPMSMLLYCVCSSNDCAGLYVGMQLYIGFGCINSQRSYVYVAILCVLQQRSCRPLCSFPCSYIVVLGVLTHTGPMSMLLYCVCSSNDCAGLYVHSHAVI